MPSPPYHRTDLIGVQIDVLGDTSRGSRYSTRITTHGGDLTELNESVSAATGAEIMTRPYQAEWLFFSLFYFFLHPLESVVVEDTVPVNGSLPRCVPRRGRVKAEIAKVG